jgi:hypothetical protein
MMQFVALSYFLISKSQNIEKLELNDEKKSTNKTDIIEFHSRL